MDAVLSAAVLQCSVNASLCASIYRLITKIGISAGLFFRLEAIIFLCEPYSDWVFFLSTAKPYFTNGAIKNEQRAEGSEFVWKCEAEGIPPPYYMWLKNGERFSELTVPVNNTNRISFSEDNKYVKFSRLDKNVDPGMYQCLAINPFGNAYSNAQLSVV